MTAGSSSSPAVIIRDDRRSARLKKTLAANALLCVVIVATLAGCAATTYPDLNRQPLPRIAESCGPRGTVASPVSAGTAEQVVERIQVTADPESAGSLVSRAWDESLAGNRERTMALYDLALQRADNSWPRGRIEWSYGWSMFNLREHACALAHFEEARVSDPTFVQWVPYTYAVTWWQLGQRDLAIDWYD
ncbi:MAG: tetratricopeptide repeat protein, partial [Usitatibacteraceae bacterium]